LPQAKEDRVEIVKVSKVTPELVDAFARLIPQLSSSTSAPSADKLAEIVASPAVVLLVARDPDHDGWIAGALTLIACPIPTGVHAYIEDVVVDEAYRRQGIGTALIRAAIERAQAAGARKVDLTSRHTREEANRLYRRLGFVRRETNVYRYPLES
jgi:ribosomal protein S18 acetylase RimI-like enzyme